MAAIGDHPSVEYLVIGHVSEDRLPSGSRLGGTVAYSGLTARALGLEVGALTSARPDLDLGELSRLHVERVPAEKNTSYENRSTATGRRSQILHSRAASLHPDQLPHTWRSARVTHLAPLASEFSDEMLTGLSEGLIGATPQGWMRTWDERGSVAPVRWDPSSRIRQAVDLVIASLEDLGGDQAEARRLADLFDPFILTLGASGATVFSAGGTWDIAAVRPEKTVDATGAGDIFAAAYFCYFSEHADPLRAAVFANYLAGCGIARLGLDSIPRADEIDAAYREAGR